MRIAVSDYDGTICTHGKLQGDVVSAVMRWQEAGNRFGIATGRDLAMTLHETERWGIPFDFLICDNGAEIYDHRVELLQHRHLEDSLIPTLIGHPAAEDSMHILLLSGKNLRAVLTPATWFPKMGVPFQEMDRAHAALVHGLSQISLAFTTPEKCLEWTEMLNEDFGGLIQTHPNQRTIDITAAGVDKASGIRVLLALKEWEGRPVHTIGDAANDISMIKAFKGYAVPGATAEVLGAASRTYADVADMLTSL